MNGRFRIRRAAVVATLLVSVLGLGSLPPLHAQGPMDGVETLRMVEDTVVPPRDRIDLARRVLGVTDIPEPPTSAPERSVGEVRKFWVDNLDEDYSFQVDAQLVYKTAHVYAYVEVAELQAVNQQALEQSVNRFENEIRPRVHEVYGTEWTPGIDGDPHVVILHARNMGNWVAAYYGSSSQFPSEAVSSSNEAEMFFVNLDTMGWVIGGPDYESTLAHEFQHMVHWSVDSNEDTWVNEGLSEMAAMLAGYGASWFASGFLEEPELQLNDWPDSDDRGLSYGSAFMFMAYLFERYGEEATRALVRDTENGLTSISNTLAAIDARDPATGEPVDAADLFADWVVANLLMDPSLGDGRYAYVFEDMARLLPIRPARQLVAGADEKTYDAPQWGGYYFAVPGGSNEQTVTLRFTGADTVGLVAASAHSGRFAWWSNRGDDSDMRLTRAFDLSSVTAATLSFQTWYDIEELWDYAYVMLSTDGGATWMPQATSRTTTTDPHDNAYGPGYTGQSGEWVEEHIDLTPYVGGEVLVRFEYITDDAVNRPGMLIDDVAVPELGYTEDFENGVGDWVSEGWLLTDNVLPQRFLVQWVQPGNTTQPVTRLLGENDMPSGEWTFNVGGAAGDAVIVVSGLAPVTTEPARFRVALH